MGLLLSHLKSGRLDWRVRMLRKHFSGTWGYRCMGQLHGRGGGPQVPALIVHPQLRVASDRIGSLAGAAEALSQA